MTNPVGTTERPADLSYDELIAGMQRRVQTLGAGIRRVFCTDAKDLYTTFLEALQEPSRAFHRCSTCKTFVSRHGHLVVIDDDGRSTPLLWDRDDSSPEFGAAQRAVADRVVRAQVTGPFVSFDTTWGRPKAGGWEHLHACAPSNLVEPRPLIPTETAWQIAARKRHDHALLSAALVEYPMPLVRRAHALLTGESLYRSEKCIGVAQWLLELHDVLARVDNARHRDNRIWRASADAPAGHCHVRSGMIGTLLDDLAADLPFPSIKAKFDAKMHPLQYLRPTAPPSAGNIAQAERIIAGLRAEGALERRFARIEDVQALWQPSTPAPAAKKPGVFSHLLGSRAEDVRDLGTPTVTLTWEKFARTVLPEAERIEFLIPDGRASFVALVTAKHADAPPILQWDHVERRNPVSLYVYVEGSLAKRWNLQPSRYCTVNAIALGPSAWGTDTASRHHGNEVVLLLEGARDLDHEKGGGFFPESLKSELHPIRATLEAYAKSATIEGRDEATACGYLLAAGTKRWTTCTLRVTARGGLRSTVQLDRWD